MNNSWLKNLDFDILRDALNKEMGFYHIGKFKLYDKESKLISEDAQNYDDINDDMIISSYGTRWVDLGHGKKTKQCVDINFGAFGSVDMIKSGFSEPYFKTELTRVFFGVMMQACKDDVIDDMFYKESFLNYHAKLIENRYDAKDEELKAKRERLDNWYNDSLNELYDITQTPEVMGE